MTEIVKLDLKDKKILLELDRNARQSNSEIAKKVGLNKNTVNYKIKRMTDEGVISKFYSTIDSSKLGYFGIRVYLKFFNTTEQDELKMIEWLKKNKSVGVVARIESIYDLAFIAWVKDIYEFQNIWFEFKKNFRKYFWKEDVHILSRVYHFKRKYLFSEKKALFEKPEIVGSRGIETYDELDMKILRILAKDSRTPLIEIAKMTETSDRTVAFRIKQLEKKKIIQGYRIDINLQKIGYEYYKVNFILNDYSKSKEILAFCQGNENIIFIDESLAELDFEIDVEIESKEKLLELINEIKKQFNVREAEIFTFREYLKLESLAQ